jgi:integrase
VVKLVVYRLDGKNVSKNTPGAVKTESPAYYILYRGRDGKQRREATGMESKTKAEALLIKRMGEIGMGMTPEQDLKGLTYEDIRDAYLRDNPEQNSDRHLPVVTEHFKGMKILKITTDSIRDFIEKRCEEDEVTTATARRDLVILRSMFNNARKEQKIGANDIPYFPMPADSEPAGQYIEPHQFAIIEKHLPANLRPFYQFLYATGCRLGAAQSITWDMVSADCTQIKIPGENTKNRQPLLIVLAGSQLEPISKMLKKMFRDAVKPVFDFTNYRKEWSKAVAKAKLGTWNAEDQTRTGVRIHDCRCSAAINLLAAGVDEGLVLKIGGWRTREMLDRYNVSDPGRIKTAMERGALFVQKQQKAAR